MILRLLVACLVVLTGCASASAAVDASTFLVRNDRPWPVFVRLADSPFAWCEVPGGQSRSCRSTLDPAVRDGTVVIREPHKGTAAEQVAVLLRHGDGAPILRIPQVGLPYQSPTP